MFRNAARKADQTPASAEGRSGQPLALEGSQQRPERHFLRQEFPHHQLRSVHEGMLTRTIIEEKINKSRHAVL